MAVQVPDNVSAFAGQLWSSLRKPISGLIPEVLHNYGIRPGRIRFLRESENLVFRVWPGSDEKALIFRIHRPGMLHNSAAPALTFRQIESEMIWLERLLEAGLPVQRPRRNKSGGYVSEVVLPPSITLCCTLLERVPGRSLLPDIQPVQMKPVGELMARIHLLYQTTMLNEKLDRPRWDRKSLAKACDAIREAARLGLISSSIADEVTAPHERIDIAMDRLGNHPGSFGLIHADMNPANIMFSRGKPSIIDFCSSGYGHYLFDIAQSLHGAPSTSFADAMLMGYNRILALPTGFEESLISFYQAALIYSACFQTGKPENLENWQQRMYPYLARQLTTVASHFGVAFP